MKLQPSAVGFPPMAKMGSLLLFKLGFLVLLANAATAPGQDQATKFYHGFDKVKYLFTFGDSYTRTGFNYTLKQPSAANPIGNPAFPGSTSANKANWVGYLTGKYNESLLLTYNLAVGGATVNTKYVSSSVDLFTQIEDQFIPTYGTPEKSAKLGAAWTASTSLFGIWIGINDVGKSYTAQNASLHPLIFETYTKLVHDLYKTGARNFVFLNVPSVELAPKTTSLGQDAVKLERSAIADFNSRVLNLATEFTKAYSDTTVFHFNTYKLFSEVIANPKAFPETAVYTNTTGVCVTSDGCNITEYLWLNNLHPTSPMHKLVARKVAALLRDGSPL